MQCVPFQVAQEYEASSWTADWPAAARASQRVLEHRGAWRPGSAPWPPWPVSRPVNNWQPRPMPNHYRNVLPPHYLLLCLLAQGGTGRAVWPAFKRVIPSTGCSLNTAARRRLRKKVSPDCLLCCLTKHIHRPVFCFVFFVFSFIFRHETFPQKLCVESWFVVFLTN